MPQGFSTTSVRLFPKRYPENALGLTGQRACAGYARLLPLWVQRSCRRCDGVGTRLGRGDRAERLRERTAKGFDRVFQALLVVDLRCGERIPEHPAWSFCPAALCL